MLKIKLELTVPQVAELLRLFNQQDANIPAPALYEVVKELNDSMYRFLNYHTQTLHSFLERCPEFALLLYVLAIDPEILDSRVRDSLIRELNTNYTLEPLEVNDDDDLY